MLNQILRMSLVVFVFFFGMQLFAVPAATLILVGQALLVNNAVIRTDPASQTLNILGGEVDRLVANVTENSNNPAGYRIFMSSINASKLIHTTRSDQAVDYTISYDRGPRFILTRLDREVKHVTSLNGLVSNSSEVRVTLNAKPNAVVGTYTDTVSISISAD